ncbi:MAG: acyclic terpene utilization AtuA family protein [Sutterellaceae bacterium]|nr:DUF1446 domain-containing protein [Burkholderiaceae bacterium]MDW8428906.1 acyclic terpene utilization AtuA family protein [Sutterellaceae bacterium]
MKQLFIGAAAGFSGDRVDAAEAVVATLAARRGPAVLIFETLAERTLALAQLRRRADPQAGYEPNLERLLRPVLADCQRHGIRIVGNFGAAHPRAAARVVLRLARELGLPPPKVAIVVGDDLGAPECRPLLAQALGAGFNAEEIVSANAYLGAEPIAEALRRGADIVITGRVADPALTLGPALAHFGWALDDWDRLARATMAGHLLECGTQVTGGYFADPGFKEVPALQAVGFPVAEIDADGHCTITKADGTGGCVNSLTVKEQLLYEIHDPAAYLTPDVVADLTAAEVHELAPDRVRLTGVRGQPRPPTLKVSVFFDGGWIGEGEISYAGPGAEARARLAAEILQRRLPQLVLRVDLIGVVSVFGDDGGRLLRATPPAAHTDVRLRVAAAHPQRAAVERLCDEVTALYTCGPAGGGGVRTQLRPRLRSAACYVPRAAVNARYEWVEAA